MSKRCIFKKVCIEFSPFLTLKNGWIKIFEKDIYWRKIEGNFLYFSELSNPRSYRIIFGYLFKII